MTAAIPYWDVLWLMKCTSTYKPWIKRSWYTCCFYMLSVWAVCSPSQAQTLLRFRSAVWTLSRISNLHIYCPDLAGPPPSAHSTAPPTGCFIGVVDHTCQLHLHIQVCCLFQIDMFQDSLMHVSQNNCHQ